MKMSILRTFFVITFLGAFTKVNAFECYTCSSNEYADLCEKDPEKLPLNLITECSGYCTILRTEYTDIPGKLVTIIRNCEKEPLVLNGVRTDKHYTRMYTSCNTAKCNVGNGKREPGDGDGGWVGPKNVIVVNEQSSGSNYKAYFGIVLALGVTSYISKLLL